MDLKIEVYCRLCAKLKPNSEVYHLQENKVKLQETLEKLTRVNARNDIEISQPKTVCFMCMNDLNSAFDFVTSVENAQKLLKDIKWLDKSIKRGCISKGRHNKNNPIITKISKTDTSGDLRDQTVDINIIKVEFESKLDADSNDIISDDETIKNTTNSTGTSRTNCPSEASDWDLDINTVKVENEIDDDSNNHVPKCDTVMDNIIFNQVINTESPDISDKCLDSGVVKDIIKLDDIDRDKSNFLKNKTGILSWCDYAWKCSACEIMFLNSDELVKHSMEKHSRCNAFCCTVCRVHRNSLRSMLSHIYKHDKTLMLSCYKCLKTFDSIFKLRAHRKTHIHSKYYCKNCYFVFPNQVELKKHREMYNRKYKERFASNIHICDVCGKTFQKKHNLVEHINLHTDSGKHECRICKKSFKSMRYLRRHVAIHDDERPFPCETCGKGFRSKKDLNVHRVVHTDMWPHKCNICGKSYRQRNKLSMHILIHSGIMPYSCKKCEWDFTNYSNYSKHMKGKHNIDIRKRKPKIEDTEDHSEWKAQNRQRKIIGRPKLNREKQTVANKTNF